MGALNILFAAGDGEFGLVLFYSSHHYILDVF